MKERCRGVETSRTVSGGRWLRNDSDSDSGGNSNSNSDSEVRDWNALACSQHCGYVTFSGCEVWGADRGSAALARETARPIATCTTLMPSTRTDNGGSRQDWLRGSPFTYLFDVGRRDHGCSKSRINLGCCQGCTLPAEHKVWTVPIEKIGERDLSLLLARMRGQDLGQRGDWGLLLMLRVT